GARSPHLRPQPPARVRARGGSPREDPRGRRDDDRQPGGAARQPRLGRPPDGLRGPQAHGRQLPPHPVPRDQRAAPRARALAEDHRRRPAPPGDQAQAGHAAAAGEPAGVRTLRRARGV
ncbi:MAG: hypothetical protein AVDCRST_MAG30-1786, partial [uncultured Solirubrobacteraceae bacterium]